MNQIRRVSWDDIKAKIKPVNPALFQVIEGINPRKDIPFYLANYDFGVHFGIKNRAYLPTDSGDLAPLDSFITDNAVFKDLGYGTASLPLGMILDKHCEWHYIAENNRLYPDCVQGPGAIFNMQIIFDEDKTVDNNVLSVSSGALSSFLLPNIGCQRKHSRLQKYFAVSAAAPKSPYEHYLVFQEILKSNKSSWQSEILYFSEQFVNEVKHNDQWLRLKLFFSEALRKKLTQNTYDSSCNDLFLSAQKVNRFRPTPFLMDTAKYIFNICMGAGIGVKPAIDEQYFPVAEIQRIYQECYGLEYTPTVMVPSGLDHESDSVYYPLQCPFAKINTFKTNQSISTLSELEKLRNVILAYQAEFTEKEGAAFGSQLYQVSQNISFSFYHYQASNSAGIMNPEVLMTEDPRYKVSFCRDETTFASDAKLFRGCVRLYRHKYK